ACNGGGSGSHPSAEGFCLRLSGESVRSRLPGRRVQCDETGAQRVQRELDAIADAELAEDVAQVCFDGLLADEELSRDVAVLAPHRDVAHDLELARCETLAVG